MLLVDLIQRALDKAGIGQADRPSLLIVLEVKNKDQGRCAALKGSQLLNPWRRRVEAIVDVMDSIAGMVSIIVKHFFFFPFSSFIGFFFEGYERLKE